MSFEGIKDGADKDISISGVVILPVDLREKIGSKTCHANYDLKGLEKRKKKECKRRRKSTRAFG